MAKNTPDSIPKEIIDKKINILTIPKTLALLIKIMYKYITLLIALSLTSCVTNWQRNRKLNEEIFEKYLIAPMAAESIKCSTAPIVK